MTEPKTAEVKVVPVDTRSSFEGWYCADMAKYCHPCTPAEMFAMREGDDYGENRLALNSKWEGWKACASSMSAPASPPAETGEAVKRARAALDRHPGNNSVCIFADDLRQILAAQPVSPSEAEAWQVRRVYEDGRTAKWSDTEQPEVWRANPNYEVRPLYTHPASDQSDTERMRAWDWLAANPNLELSYGYPGEPEDPGAWMLHRVNGGVNDREWTLIASADTPLDAVVKARATLAEKAADKSAATGEA